MLKARRIDKFCDPKHLITTQVNLTYKHVFILSNSLKLIAYSVPQRGLE